MLRYEEGNWHRRLPGAMAAGRGCHPHGAHYENVPLIIPVRSRLRFGGRGHQLEGVSRHSTGLDEPYAHPRNLAAGSVRKLNAEVRGAGFPSWPLTRSATTWAAAPSGRPCASWHKWGSLQWVIPSYAGASEEAIRQAMDFYQPKEYAYPTDGLIFEFNDLAYGRSLGATGHHENRMTAFSGRIPGTKPSSAAWRSPRPARG